MRRSKRSRVAAEDDAEPAVEDGGGSSSSSSSSAPATEDFQLALEREKLERQGEVAKLVAEKQRLSDSCLRLQQEKLALEDCEKMLKAEKKHFKVEDLIGVLLL